MNILVAGVYGVGKTFISELIKNTLQIPAFTASQLIKHSVKNKSIKDIRKNQSELINAVLEINKKYRNIIIDGHFCLINSKKEIEVIDVDVFQALNIKKIILLYDDVIKIEERLLYRDGTAFNIELIEKIQKKEAEQAQLVSKELGIPLLNYHVTNQTIEELIQFIVI